MSLSEKQCNSHFCFFLLKKKASLRKRITDCRSFTMSLFCFVFLFVL